MASDDNNNDGGNVMVNNTTTLMFHDFMIIIATVMIWRGVSLACDDIAQALGLTDCKYNYLIWSGIGLLCMWFLLKKGIKKNLGK